MTPFAADADSARSQVTSAQLPLRPYVSVRHADVLSERCAGADEDVHFSSAVARAVIEDLTHPGDRVLDPFVGFGTTLRAATELGRVSVGVELLPERCATTRQVAPEALVIEGDARGLSALVAGPFDLVLTSPPYRTEFSHPDDPLTAYTRAGGDYDGYLDDLTRIFAACLAMLTPSGYLVVNVANIAADSGFTPLAWDLGLRMSAIGQIVQDVPVCWDQPLHDLAGDHLIVVRASHTQESSRIL
ncbi:TRM11 family SAM-dependent methyltransferase [Demetria terragena]|uniref:TRM11 family SAM-dependent methyltransferase n=1 Tax=Demetria terragena TaxID=63959 RepID=UPI000361CC40|nr:DNA methyltransferase [Demetria terragena]